MHHFPCPTCGKVLKVDDATLAGIRASGQGTQCPACKAQLGIDAFAAHRERPESQSGPPALLPPKLISEEWVDPAPGRLTRNPPQQNYPTPSPQRDSDEPRERTKRCRYCGETILRIAKKCKHCGEFLDRRREYDDDDDDYPEPRGGTDAPGVISLIFGCLSVVLTLMGCFTCGITYWVAAPFAAVGAILGFFGRGNTRVAAVTLNLIALIPAVILLWMFALGHDLEPPVIRPPFRPQFPR
jgi:hypothetical protein